MDAIYQALITTFYYFGVSCIALQCLTLTLNYLRAKSARRCQQERRIIALLADAREILDRDYSDAQYAYFEDEVCKYTLADYVTADELLSAIFAHIDESTMPGIVPSDVIKRRRTVRVLGKMLTLPLSA